MHDTLPARMFNAVGRHLGDGWWLPLTQRKNIADALYGLVRPELEELRAGIPLVCSDERHHAKVAALEAELGRLRAGCRSTAVLLRATADQRPDPHALRAAATALDELAGRAPEVPDGA